MDLNSRVGTRPSVSPSVRACIRNNSCISYNLKKTTEANLMKRHRKINHNEKVYRAQEVVSTPKVKAAGSKVESFLNLVSAIT